jgi:integrase
MNEDSEKLEAYLKALCSQGEKIPAQANLRRQPHIRAISAATGIPFRRLYSPSLRIRIDLAVKEIGVKQRETQREMRKNTFLRNCELISTYLKLLQSWGLKLPEDPDRRGQVFYAQLGVEAGVNHEALKESKNKPNKSQTAQLREIVSRAASELGVEIRILLQHPSRVPPPITYQYLLEQGTVNRIRELKGKPNARQQGYNTRGALIRYRKTLGLGAADVVGDEFVSTFKDCIARVLETISNTTTRKKFQTEITWWRDYYQRLINRGHIPDGLSEALMYLIDSAELPTEIIAKLARMPASRLYTWSRGICTPVLTNIIDLSRLESLFRLPVGTLTNKASHTVKCFRPNELPDFLRQSPHTYRKVSRHLPPDFCEMSAQEQYDVVDSIMTTVIKSNDSYNRWLAEMQKFRYQLPEWPSQLQDEFNKLISFKTARLPPIGMRRNQRWRPTTAKINRTSFAHFFGAISLPSNAEDIKIRGLDFPKEHLTLALIACPLLVDWYIRFKAESRGQYTEYLIKLLYNFKSMLRAGTGWLRQQPQLGRRLRQFSCGTLELVPQSLVDRAQADWDRVCEDAITYYGHLTREISPLVTIVRDPFRLIQGIVRRDDPMEAFEVLLRGMKEELPNYQTQPVYYHLNVRDRALVSLIALTGLRRNTVSQLDYTGDDRGHLTFVRKKYVLNIPRAFFKEQDSPYFGPKNAKRDYFMELRDAFGMYSVLTEYLKVSRPFLLERFHPNCTKHPLFVSSFATKEARASCQLISIVFNRATEKHLVENKSRGTGIAQVGRIGPHAVRQIRGTAAYKKTGSYEIAGDANHHGAEMSRRYYTQFSPDDRNRRVNDALFGPE